jgi:2-iminoacetate synthase
VIQFFAPLYLSNECVNTCLYCGYSRELSIRRRTLTLSEVRSEAAHLLQAGFRHLLLVAGEHPKFIPVDYLEEVTRLLHREAPSLAVEVAPLDEAEYRRLTEAGCEGLVVYQETYDRKVYDAIHVKGPKKDFDSRLETPERGARAGMRRIGIGVLLGLSPDWRRDTIALVAHAQFLMRHYWKCFITVAVPRLRPAAGDERHVPKITLSDREFVQLVTALRLALPDAGIVLSTREPARLRDGLVRLGVTHMSAGSRTEPGGYTEPEAAGEQFEIEDSRSPAEVAAAVEKLGYEPVFKDWEAVLHGL